MGKSEQQTIHLEVLDRVCLGDCHGETKKVSKRFGAIVQHTKRTGDLILWSGPREHVSRDASSAGHGVSSPLGSRLTDVPAHLYFRSSTISTMADDDNPELPFSSLSALVLGSAALSSDKSRITSTRRLLPSGPSSGVAFDEDDEVSPALLSDGPDMLLALVKQVPHELASRTTRSRREEGRSKQPGPH